MGHGNDEVRARRTLLCWPLCVFMTVSCGSSSSRRIESDAAGLSDARVADADGSGECSTHQDCVDKHARHWICRRPEHVCVSLTSPECTLTRGDDSNDDAVFVGVLAVEGAPLFGVSELAQDDFTEALGGLPTLDGATTRPLVLVGCSFLFGQDPLPAARHLAETIGVPAIVGPQGSQSTIDVAQNVTIPAGVLLISPTAQSELVSGLKDDDLVFRTSPTTEDVAPQLAAMLTDVEAVVKAERSLSEVKIALISPRDAYGITLSKATTSVLRFNDGLSAEENEQRGRFLAISYDGSEADFEAAVAKRVVEFGASIVVSLTPAEQRAFKAIEESWPAGEEPPYYLFAGGFSNESVAFAASRPDSLRARVLLASSGDPTRPLYEEYAQRIQREFGTAPALLATVGGYDATYAVAFGIMAQSQTHPTGREIASGIRQLLGPGTRVGAKPSQVARGAKLLRSEGRFDLDGVSGPLDFDANGDVLTDGSVDCLVRDTITGAVSLTFSGQVFRAATGKLEGSAQFCD